MRAPSRRKAWAMAEAMLRWFATPKIRARAPERRPLPSRTGESACSLELSGCPSAISNSPAGLAIFDPLTIPIPSAHFKVDSQPLQAKSSTASGSLPVDKARKTKVAQAGRGNNADAERLAGPPAGAPGAEKRG